MGHPVLPGRTAHPDRGRRGKPRPGGSSEVRQAGERTLWDEIQAAYRWWIDAGRPTVDAWQFTVKSTGQRIQLAGSQDQGAVG